MLGEAVPTTKDSGTTSLGPMTPQITNVFTATLGKKAIKWDAFWHLFEWLIESDGHGLGSSIRSELILFAFGEVLSQGAVKREHPVSGQTDGKGRWADLALGFPTLTNPTHLILMDDIGAAGSGGQRKLTSLLGYMSLSQRAHPTATIRAIIVSDIAADKKLAPAVYEVLGDEAVDFLKLGGWKLLPLHTVGGWVENAIKRHEDELTRKMSMILRDFVEWCG